MKLLEQKIKETFDQIHAPRALIEEAHREAHSKEGVKYNKKRKSSSYQKVVAFVATAASIALIIIGVNLLNKGKPILPLGDGNTVNLGGQIQGQQQSFQGIKSKEEWTKQVDDFVKNQEETMKLTATYIIGSNNVARDSEEYRLTVQVKEGKLERLDKDIQLSGQFECVVYKEEQVIKKIQLSNLLQMNVYNNEIKYQVVENDKDETISLILEKLREDGTTELVTYELNNEWSIIS